MAGFLRVHVMHERSEVRIAACYGWGLGGVNKGCGELACLVHTKLVLYQPSVWFLLGSWMDVLHCLGNASVLRREAFAAWHLTLL